MTTGEMTHGEAVEFIETIRECLRLKGLPKETTTGGTRVSLDGVRLMPLRQWADELGVTFQAVHIRLKTIEKRMAHGDLDPYYGWRFSRGALINAKRHKSAKEKAQQKRYRANLKLRLERSP
jgi:hypothetical protein